ncbi:natural killer cells antigen CD94-like [Gadus chalcogrammus]|uniref:natural killer cells antigen CD94-like n=1 Tax=Gadus chalcogrammus TaxID=1042646 RepID=UPI0024C4CC8B|nr:natural killer cells antigen CD94-like [Gadus chalcogrammus]
MAEVIYARPNMMTKARNTQGEREERIVEIYVTSESLREHVGTEESSNTLGTVRGQQPDPVSPPRCPIRAAVVLLVLLSVALLAGLLGLAVQHKTVLDRDVEQLLQRLKNVTEQRDTLLCKQECPGGWDRFGCKCYGLSKERESWNKSREFCVSQGADLLVVDSEEEMDFIYGKDLNGWLGATDEASEGMWRWVDGTVLSVVNPAWFSGKPDVGKEKNCLRRFRGTTNFKWTDESCEANNYGLCELDLRK